MTKLPNNGEWRCCWCADPVIGTALFRVHQTNAYSKPIVMHLLCATTVGLQAMQAQSVSASIVEFERSPIWSSEVKDEG